MDNNELGTNLAEVGKDCISRQAVIKAFSEWRDDDDRDLWQVIDEVLAAVQCEDAVSRETVKEQMLKYGFRAPDMTVTEFVEDCLPSVTPKQRTGKWILDRSGACCCSECMEPCASYVMMKPRDKFCKMCGSRNEVTT